MYLTQTIAIAVKASKQVTKTSKKEYKDNETLRRSRMTPEERSYEDTCKFNKRLMRF